jgi:MoxR-like ATPase
MTPARRSWPGTIDEIDEGLRGQGYLPDEALATVVFVACDLGRPLLVEGEAGVGKTELAKALAGAAGTKLVRLQCYEGIDAGQALYDWDFRRQILYLRSLEAAGTGGGAGAVAAMQAELFDRAFLIERPVLQALQHRGRRPAVLLIDEIDRADEAFEAFLLEVLSDYQVTVPEVGTIRARRRPWVVITSNRTRELHDATKRRCLYHWLDWPNLEREVAIVAARVPGVPEALARQVCLAVERLRRMELYKSPGIAETIDWVQTVLSLGRARLDPDLARRSLGAVLKNEQDYKRVASSDLETLLTDQVA